MSKQSTADQRATPRVKKYHLEDDAWVEKFLEGAAIASIGVVDGEQPYINANLFYFDASERQIYFHTAIGGRLRDAIRNNPNACITAFEMGRLIPDRKPLKFSAEYCGVVAFGKVTVVLDDVEKRRALQRILDKYAPHLEAGRDYDPIDQGELDATTLFRMDIDAWSGKGKRRAADYPGAFEYEFGADPLLQLAPLL